MCSGNFNCLPGSTFNCQSHTDGNSPVGTFCHELGFSPSLMNAMFGLPGGWYLLCLIQVQMTSATAFSTWSWCSLYLPSLRAFGQQLKMYSRDPLPGQSGHAGVSANPPFDQVIFQVDAWSQLVQAPCWRMATVLLRHSSSTSARISPWITCRLSLHWALL